MSKMNGTNVSHFDILDIEEIEFQNQLPQHNGKIAYLSVIFVVSLISNLILIFQQFRKIRKPLQSQSQSIPYMLISLAVANLISTFATILVHAVWFSFTWWHAGNFMCKLVMFFRAMEHFVRPYSVVGLLMAYIAERVTKRDGKTTAAFFIIPAWVIGCLLSTPMFLIFNAQDQSIYEHTPGSGPQVHQCSLHGYMNLPMMIITSLHAASTVVMGFLFPCLISCVLSCVTCCIRKKGGDSEKESNSKIHYDPATQECTHDQTPLDIPTQPEDIKPNHLPLVINIIFFIMYLQFVVFLITIPVSGDSPNRFNHIIWVYFTGTSSVAVTAIVAVLGSLESFPKCRAIDGFKFRRMTPDV